MKKLISVFALGSLLSACGGGDCKLDDPKSCSGGQVCETVTGKEKPMCFQPVLVQGKVFELGATGAISGAQVTAVDANGAAAGPVVVSGGDGTYSLRVPTVRSDEKGTPTSRKVSLRASAANYQPFPSGVRVSLPIDTSTAARASDGKPWIVTTPLSDIGLVALPDGEKGRPAVSGTVERNGSTSVLVVLDNGVNAYSTIADESGAFKIFNVNTAGNYKINGFSKGANYTSQDLSVQAEVTGVTIAKAGSATATLSGKVQLVGGADGRGTSVVLVHTATFNPTLVRGETVPGLRAPEGSGPPNITGDFSISGIPDGKYTVLAGFENDNNVRDPDPGISGTQILQIEVTNGSLTASPSFKVTKAVEMVGPGAGETVEEVTGTPTFKWKAFSNAQLYQLVVYGSTGTKLYENLNIADVRDKDGNISAQYLGTTPLKAGQIYLWKVLALRQGAPTSSTEDLKGLFTVK